MTDPLSPEEIAELRQLHAGATPGRWHKYQTGIGEFICGVAPGRGNTVYADTPGGTRPSADLSLIVAAHSALPRLLAIATDHARLVAENAKLRERVGLLEDLCRKAINPRVSYWMVVEPEITAALAACEEEDSK